MEEFKQGEMISVSFQELSPAVGCRMDSKESEWLRVEEF